MTKLQFFVYDITYKAKDNIVTTYLFGRGPDGKRIIVLDSSFQPYFLIKEKEEINRDKLIEKLKNIEIKGLKRVLGTEETKKKKIGKDVELLKVYVSSPKNVEKVARIARNFPEVDEILEFDVDFVKRYIIENSITPLTLLEAEGEFVDIGLSESTFKAKDVKQLEETTIKNLRLLAFDIETYNPDGRIIQPKKNPIIMVSFYGDGFEKVITWKRFKTDKKYIEFVDGEQELLERFIEVIRAYKPEVITGYFSDGFDFPYIEERAEKYQMTLNLGLDKTDLIVDKKRNGKARIKGIVHIDIFKFIRKVIGRMMETQRYDLNSVSEELLGEKKKDVNLDNLAKVWDAGGKELEEYCHYNLIDSVLAYDLAKKVMPNIIEISKIVRMLPFDSTRRGLSQLVESYLMYMSKECKEIIPRKPAHNLIGERRDKRSKGAFVVEPTAGVYEDVVVLDFRSLYPTIIISHNISEDTLNCEECRDATKVPGLDKEYWFCKKRRGFIPTIIENLISRRSRIKEMIKGKEKRDAVLLARGEILKLLSSSMHGYYGFFGSRWYCLECSESILAWARDYITNLIAKTKKEGFQVIYGDTDSVFLVLNGKSVEDVKKFVNSINRDLPGAMELEYEGHFTKGIFVDTKSGTGGAKKKYALLSPKGNIKVVGFETVRRNWSLIAKEVQKEILNILLKENDVKKAVNYIRHVLEELKKHNIPIEKVLIRTQLQKSVDSYVQIGPHVAVAKRMKLKGESVGPGSLIEYVIVEGGGMIRDRAFLVDELDGKEYDANYYIDNQVLPAIESILAVYGYSIEKIKTGHSQSGLGDFF